MTHLSTFSTARHFYLINMIVVESDRWMNDGERKKEGAMDQCLADVLIAWRLWLCLISFVDQGISRVERVALIFKVHPIWMTV